jgi:hypothetical protein
MESTESRSKEAVGTDALELMVSLFFADWTVSRAAAETPTEGVRFLTPAGVVEIVRRIEDLVLDGLEIDRVVEQLSAIHDTVQNQGQPIEQYQFPDRREKSQMDIQILLEGIRGRRSATRDGIFPARDGDVSRLLRDLGLYIRELGAIRSSSTESWESTLTYFTIQRKRKELPGEARDRFRRTIRETAAFADERMVELLSAVEALEKGEQAAAWARRKSMLIALRAVVIRQLADALIAQARRLREDPREEGVVRGPREDGFPPFRRPPHADGRRGRRRAGRVADDGEERTLGAVPRAERGGEREGDDRANPPAAPGGGFTRVEARGVLVSACGAATGG